MDVLDKKGAVQRTAGGLNLRGKQRAALKNVRVSESISVNSVQWTNLQDTVIWDLGNKQLQQLVFRSCMETGLVAHYNLDACKLQSFIKTIAAGYMNNPYHNFYHAAQVFQGCFVALTKYNCARSLRPVEQLALLTAALCHDVDHPGVSNGFLRKIKHPFAVYYDDVSVLENHHVSYTLRLLSKYIHIDFRTALDSETRQCFHLKLVQAILATDMETSEKLIVLFDQRSQAFEFPRLSEPDRELLMCFMLHCMDISNVLTVPPINRNWAALITAEFAHEAALNEQTSPIKSVEFFTEAQRWENDKNMPHSNVVLIRPRCRTDLQINFLKLSVLPKWSSLCRITGEFHDLTAQGRSNLRNWVELRRKALLSPDTSIGAFPLPHFRFKSSKSRPLLRRIHLGDTRQAL